jgi:hypothetical protein
MIVGVVAISFAVQLSVAQANSTRLPSQNPKATATLTELPIKGRAPKTGYSRSKFGSAWLDVDGNGCDNRNDILRRDFTNKTYLPGTCKVAGGDWLDPYTGNTYHFDHRPSEVPIDHVVALSDAWQKGAQQLSVSQRKQFANDPLNLIPTSRSINSQKSDSDAASWLPPRKSFRCAYVARQIAVKKKYKLWVTQAEHNAMATVLAKPECAGVRLPNANTPVR